MPAGEFHIYGEGPSREDLVAQVRALGLESRILIKDRVPFDQVAALMANADVGVVPKRAEGFGGEAFSTKILEFMACGVPVIVSRTRIDSYYFDESVVHFFTSGDEHELANALIRAHERRGTLDAWITAGRECAKRYSWESRSIDYQAILDSLVADAHRRRAVAF
jgi:glycosyltransferase involved in cell wall biosynthesis